MPQLTESLSIITAIILKTLGSAHSCNSQYRLATLQIKGLLSADYAYISGGECGALINFLRMQNEII